VHRADIQWPVLWLAIIGRLPGTALAVWLMSVTGTDGIKVFIGSAVLIAVALSLFKVHIEPNGRNHIIAGFFSGLSGTATSIGGPPMALLYQQQQGNFVRANLSAYFAIGSVISLGSMATAGFVTEQSWVYFGYFLPATLIGVWLGMKLRHALKPTFMRPAILILCSSSALVLLVQTLWL
jgi:uncharacterized membrane protein YfcA